MGPYALNGPGYLSPMRIIINGIALTIVVTYNENFCGFVGLDRDVDAFNDLVNVFP